MAETIALLKNKRRPWLAIVLSLIVPGLGHLYCGRIVRGLGLAFLFGLFGSLIWVAIAHLSPIHVSFFSILLLAYFVIWLIPAIDSYFVAKHTKSDYEPRDYNRLIVYVLWAVMSTSSSITGALHFRAKLLEAFRVPVASDYPTIVPDDRILANKLAYKNSDPQRGDLVVFINPEDRRARYIKRVVAVAGDTVEIKNSDLYINDRKLQRRQLPDFNLDRIKVEIHGELLKGDVYEEINGNAKYKIFLAQPPHDNTSADFTMITVPKHHCFVLGDNRNLSIDSKNFGPVLLATIIGRADYIYWPARDFSRFGSLSPQ
jgi:signal peptidase I